MVEKSYKKQVYYLIGIATVIRLFLAWFTEFGNDEVYYRLYAMYPDWSHFDHPLMVGIVMQITTLNLFLKGELFFRLSSVIFVAVNTWVIYRIGTKLKDERTGFYSAILYTTSIYASVISGVFILPDGPQSFFWMLSVYMLVISLPSSPYDKKSGSSMLFAGLFIGLGILSKYTTIFLWGGAALYILFFNRVWLKSWKLYVAILISITLCMPILVWNIQNDFISFTFHSDRVDMVGRALRMDYFFTELIGEILYNNPLNFVFIILGLVCLFRKKMNLKGQQGTVILFLGLPLIITFLVFSLTRSTLPHWTAPGYTTLIPIGAVFIASRQKNLKRLLPVSLVITLLVMVTFLIAALFQINYGIIKIDNTTEYHRIGKNDPTLDMFGYRQLGDKFHEIRSRDIKSGEMPADAVIVGDNWFPLANYDYYIASQEGMHTVAIGKLDRIHKYAWINRIEGMPYLGMDAWYITDSREYDYPDKVFNRLFEKVIPADTINLYRGGEVAKRAFVFRMKNLQELPADVLERNK